jgi:ADP-heptose:LPS heptosyltransferase
VLPLRGSDRIVLHPGSGDPKKNVPTEIWAEVVGELKRETGGPVGLAVGPAELERGGWEKLRTAVDSVHECLTIGDLLAAFSRARIFLGNDSGAAHLAGLLGIPTVAVFGPTDLRLWRPLGPRVRVVRARWSCAPCSLGGPIVCEDSACLDTVAAEAVLSAAVGLLEGDGNR